MANIKSAKKRARQNITKRAKNRSTVKTVRTAEKKFLKALPGNHNASTANRSQKQNTTKDLTSAKELLRIYTSKIDKAAQKGIIKTKTASRKISRLSKRIQAHL